MVFFLFIYKFVYEIFVEVFFGVFNYFDIFSFILYINKIEVGCFFDYCYFVLINCSFVDFWKDEMYGKVVIVCIWYFYDSFDVR